MIAPGRPGSLQGLTSQEVADRAAKGQTNAGGQQTSRTFAAILRANILTPFNFILGALLAIILVAGHPLDALFGIVLVGNALIGIVQEYRAKRTLDRLAILNAPRASVIRDGREQEVPIEVVVVDDLVAIRTGDQVVADGTVVESDGLELDESLLTGESETVNKASGAKTLSGSFVVAGSGYYQATAVGADAYARKLTAEARRFTRVRSELVDGVNRILGYVTWAIPPVAALLLFSQFHAGVGWRDALTGMVAALVGMVPQGLVLLTSIAFGVAAVTLAQRRVLVQELPAVEGLARVDVVCCDKTGTLTDGTIVFERVEALDPQATVQEALTALAADENRNATLAALAAAFDSPSTWVRTANVPFSSLRKWSAASFAGHGSWVLGAPEMVLHERQTEVLAHATHIADTGRRVLVLARSAGLLDGEQLPADLAAAALVVFAEHVREDAPAALAYFARQGVTVKVVSGDSPHTVGAVAARVGLKGAENPFDARSLPDDIESLGVIMEQRSVFGRVAPKQKQLMVKALQACGHTVAMFGDGVNDALALKLADTGVAMGNGAPATKAVAQLVLLDGRFSTMPGVVAEGRRVTANIERVANLFITKTVWATLLAIAASVALLPYPLLPRHLTIIDAFTIGIPAFFLALAPNLRRYIPGFVGRVLRFTIPAGIAVAIPAFAAFWLARSNNLSVNQQRTAATLVALIVQLGVLIVVAWPLTWRRSLLVGGVIAGFALLFPLEQVRRFAAIELPRAILLPTLLLGLGGAVVVVVVWAWQRRSASVGLAGPTPGGSGTGRVGIES